MIFGVSWWWILLAAVVYFVIGAAWYSKPLFARPWAKALGREVGDMGGNAAQAMVVTFVAIVVLTVAEAYLLHVTKTPNLWRGVYLAFKLWLGFVATTALVNNSFQSASKSLFAIDQGYHLVGMVAAALILVH